MKTNFKQLAALALALTVTFASCSKDNGDDNNIDGKGTANVQLVVNTGASSATRAATGNEGAVVGTEDKLASAIDVFVFNASSGLLEYAGSQAITGTTTDNSFQVTTGDKYFYVFSDPNSSSLLGLAAHYGTTLHFSVFETLLHNETKTAIETAEGVNMANTTTGAFINATLWREKKTISASGTVSVNVGRTVGKIRVNPLTTIATNMAGAFSAPQVRLGSTPIKSYFVGQYAGSVVPPGTGTGHGAVTSAVHTEPWEDPMVSGAQNPVFANYATWTAIGTNAALYYGNENTTKADGTGKLYYGNTTYVEVETIYTPDPSEVKSAADYTVAGGALSGGTFYTATVNGVKYIFDATPTDARIDVGSVVVYTNGKNYHKFPVRDRGEVGLENQCRVLRNHIYDITINRIDQLGEGTPGVDPSTPIVEEVDVKVTINVLQWSKVTQGENL